MSRCLKTLWLTLATLATLFVADPVPAFAQARDAREFAAAFWDYLHLPKHAYTNWSPANVDLKTLPGPDLSGPKKSYANREAEKGGKDFGYGSILVTEHYAADGQTLSLVVARYRIRAGYDPRFQDWYFVKYGPDGALIESSIDPLPATAAVSPEPKKVATKPVPMPQPTTTQPLPTVTLPLSAAGSGPFAKPGFITKEEDGRLWVFASGSKEWQEFQSAGELAKHTTLIGAGPTGMTLKAPDRLTALDYLSAVPGFAVFATPEDRLWVFHAASKEAQEYPTQGPPEKHLTRIGAGPLGLTIKSPDGATIDAYLEALKSSATK